MKPLRLALPLLGVGLLSACGGAGHPVCVDARSTQDYSLQWQDAIAKARQSGKLTIDQVVEAQGKSYEQLGLLKQEDWSGFCTLLDDIRADTGF